MLRVSVESALRLFWGYVIAQSLASSRSHRNRLDARSYLLQIAVQGPGSPAKGPGGPPGPPVISWRATGGGLPSPGAPRPADGGLLPAALRPGLPWPGLQPSVPCYSCYILAHKDHHQPIWGPRSQWMISPYLRWGASPTAMNRHRRPRPLPVQVPVPLPRFPCKTPGLSTQGFFAATLLPWEVAFGPSNRFTASRFTFGDRCAYLMVITMLRWPSSS